MAEIRLDQVVKIYPYVQVRKLFPGKKAKAEYERQRAMPYRTSEGVIALQRTSFTVKDGELLVLMGPSGCGKSTILRMIAGLEEVTDGEIYFDGKPMEYIQTKDRNVAMIFQNYALYPHLTVFDNIAFTLTTQRVPREEIEERVHAAAELLGISKHLYKRPKELSGGEKQRVAIGRAMVRDPDVFLMDEPFSNLDAGLRQQMRTEVRRLHDKLGKTFVYVTHDQAEALALGDRIVAMDHGIVQQIGTPAELYSKPANGFVAGFIGVPQMNFFEGIKLFRKEDGIYGTFGGYDIKAPATPAVEKALKEQRRVAFGVRPVYFRPDEEGVPAVIEAILTTGTETQITVASEGRELNSVIATIDVGNDWRRGSKIRLKPDAGRVHVFDQKTGVALS